MKLRLRPRLFHLSLSLLSVVTLFSCERPIIPTSSGGDDDGNLQVSVFQIEKIPFADAMSRAQASQVCNRLCFAVYDMTGKRVKQFNQKADDTSFGTASFRLSAGKYQVVVVAHSSSGNPTMTNPAKIKFDNADGYSDTFLHTETVEITDEDEVDLSVQLERIVALCRFVITDDMPDGVDKLLFQYKGGSGAFDANTGLGCVNSTQKMSFDADPQQKEYDLYTFLHDETGTIHLLVVAYDANDNVMCEREFDVSLTRRSITRFSGPYFTGGASDPFSISVVINTDWENEYDVTF